MGAESDGKEDTEDEGPQPTLLAVRLFEPFADAMVMLVVMMTAEAETMKMQLVCTFGSMAVLYICYKLIERIDPDIFKEERDVEI